MEERRRRKHQAQKRALAVCRDLRRFFGAAPGGRTTVATLKRAVADQAARYAAQEQCRIDQKMASDRGRKARRMLYVGLRYVAIISAPVSRANGSVPAFDKPAWTSDAALIARAEVMLGVASPHEELFVNKGLLPGFLATLSREVAALKKAKDDVTRARARFTAATVAFDRGLDAGDAAIAIIVGILTTSPDAPVGALAALRQAKRIGPRVTEVDESAKPVQERIAPAMRASQTQCWFLGRLAIGYFASGGLAVNSKNNSYRPGMDRGLSQNSIASARCPTAVTPRRTWSGFRRASNGTPDRAQAAVAASCWCPS